MDQTEVGLCDPIKILVFSLGATGLLFFRGSLAATTTSATSLAAGNCSLLYYSRLPRLGNGVNGFSPFLLANI